MCYKRWGYTFFSLICILILITGVNLAAPQFKLHYKVSTGDSLYEIANQFGVSVQQLRKTNNLNNESIRTGDKLVIPYNHQTEINQEKNKSYQFDRKLLAKLRNNSDQNFAINQLKQEEIVVKISQDSSAEVDLSQLRTLDYYVKPGDTLYELAQEFNTTVAVIRKLNDLKEETVIRLDDKLALPINNLSPKEVLSKTISQRELSLLARLISAEARGEPFIGQVAVGAVVLNRVLSRQFPDAIRDVIYQSGQFSVVSDGTINRQPTQKSYRAAKNALSGQDPSRGALYFYNPQTAKTMWWLSNRRTLVRIGDHVFAE
ncbi:MAG: cell wall hydrolase [Bacillota bacterium]